MNSSKTSDPISANRNPLTPEEAAHIADSLAGAEFETAARVLLLCFALANEPETNLRDDMLAAITERLAPQLAPFDAMMKAELRHRLKALRGEKGQ